MNLNEELEREAAHADSMASIAQYWMARAQKAEREKLEMLAAVVSSAGGEIRVPNGVLLRVPELELLLHQDFSKDEFALRVRALDTAPPAR